jgi:hypothetical protein
MDEIKVHHLPLTGEPIATNGKTTLFQKILDIQVQRMKKNKRITEKQKSILVRILRKKKANYVLSNWELKFLKTTVMKKKFNVKEINVEVNEVSAKKFNIREVLKTKKKEIEKDKTPDDLKKDAMILRLKLMGRQ